ncbi:MAG: creatininase family protein [Cyclobacteriaceae bacterium]|nr:creatininase family protein [Cyclobacteriaceae bacterium]
MRPFILTETNWKSVKGMAFELAVLPWGACEAHNYHLPYGTDIIEAEHIAAESARKVWDKGIKLIVLPAVPFGVNTGQFDIDMDLNMNPSTQLIVLQDIIQTLHRQDIHKLIILNSHGGNDFKQMIRELGLKFPSMFISQCNWFQAIDQQLFFTTKDDHAGEMETSLMLHLRPDLVRPLSEAGEGKGKRFRFQAIREGWAWAERAWSQVTDDTGVGNPKEATAEKGEKYFNAVTDKVAQFLEEVAVTERRDFYV